MLLKMAHMCRHTPKLKNGGGKGEIPPPNTKREETKAMYTNTNAKTPRHIPRYKTGYWRPVKPWGDEISKPRRTKRGGTIQQWADAIADGERDRAERFKNRRVTLALAIGEAVIIVALSALWVYVCTM